ncbi:UNVERIFIED_CONTAM: hypothetical protein GTU68_060927 [Idotea baltica]|nr:hypothetical protein [Idotea baltica]
MRKDLLVVAVVALIAGAIVFQNTSTSSAFDDWKANYGANWSQDEEQYRKIIFERNVEIIEKHNSDASNTYKMGINQFSAITDEEFANIYLAKMDLIEPMIVEETEIVGADIDWVAKGAVSGIKNQGQCGSCWAFSTTGVLESMSLKKGHSVSLSEQQLVDCSGSYGNQGCNGGWPSSALKYVKASGIASESEYPYTAKNGACKKQGGSFKISSMGQVSGCSGLQTGIQNEPLSVTVDATNWSRYSSGVFSNCAASINHAVLLVGITGGNWKIKNSWGTGWGEHGYIRLASGNTCGLCHYPAVYAA